MARSHAHQHDHGRHEPHLHRDLHRDLRLDGAAPARGDVHRIGRRRFLTDLGRSTFAVAILGGVAAACSSDETGSPTSTTSSSSSSGASSPDALVWEQVSFGFVSAYVLARGNRAAIVDTGTSGGVAQIGDTLALLGLTFDDVDHVVLTHHHGDHVGSLPGVMTEAVDATAYAGELDIANISGAELVAVGDGDDVFGLEVIETPGHTPGSISLFDPGIGLLVAGDALNGNDDGTAVAGPNAQFTADMTGAEASVAKLAGLDGVETALFGHGQPVLTGAGDLLAALA